MKTLTLQTGNSIPILGFGTWQLTGDQCIVAVVKALEVGYTHIDTADAYGNHKEVAQAIKKSAKKRDELFITTKVWRDSLKKNDLKEAASRFLDELEIEYIDLLLIHWPNKDIPLQESLEGMVELQQEGIIKSYGVSNFTIHHLQDSLDLGFHPDCNQIELHPSFSQPQLKSFCDEHGIVVTAYSPIARGQDLDLPLIQELAEKYQRSASQIILNWLIMKNIIAIPKSSKENHIEDNFKALEWEMEEDDIQKIDQLNSGNRMGIPTFNEFYY